MLKESHKSVEKLVNEHVQKWIAGVSTRKDQDRDGAVAKEAFLPNLAISRQRGSGGWRIGQAFAEKTGFRLFDSEILNEIAKNLKISKKVLKTIDEQNLSRMEIFINRLFRNRYIEPNDFQNHLVQTVLSIAEHGKAVFVGRAAYAIIPPERCLRLRCVAPLEIRIANISRELKLSEDEARFDVIQKDRDREVFIKQNFGLDVQNEVNFDLILNTQRLALEEAIRLIEEMYFSLFRIRLTDERLKA
jgi:CMP/dCMP kinase